MPLVASSGLATGVNAYLVVLVLGLADRFWQLAQVPDVLARTDVLVVAGVLYAVEFVADKIPYVDSSWDAISTAIRPTIGAVIGVLLAGDVSTLEQAVYAVVGGGAALAAHGVKAGLRLAINTSPEPVTNATTSVAEDLGVATVVLLAVTHPWLALGVALVLLASGVSLVVVLVRKIRSGWKRWTENRSQRVSSGS
ncbi:DUF4126 domain-containing protein [Nocardioides iriomotensis]|uniref:DUF4126 domain-containing protein n=1 Tax=Nocardioides iriomotensis TaxID=715784 RepID=A0A4Q5J0J3_9ACTN|nr:DUF4126 domain-containing protein [Nocardioides iriomotensis]RYU12060.1 DUF4126 domain-containing protein [Nocardioides iriomotensis]